MKRILLTIAYDGTDYHGWQVQPNGITVQQTVQEGLSKILGTKPGLTGCSRTDAGVHAREFFCHFDCDAAVPEEAFLLGLNSVLPDDIAVIGCREVPPDFHARYAAKGKRYVYQMYTGAPDPFLSRYALRLERIPDTDKIEKFCKMMIGKHDFEGFSSSGKSVVDTIRTVTDCRFSVKENRYEFCISADGFLYNMVRIIVGTAIDVSDGRCEVTCAETIFKQRNRALAGKTAPAKGLFLDKVFY